MESLYTKRNGLCLPTSEGVNKKQYAILPAPFALVEFCNFSNKQQK